jgi:hypothetical protein
MSIIDDLITWIDWEGTFLISGSTEGGMVFGTVNAVVGVVNACRELFLTLLNMGGDLVKIVDLIPLPPSWKAVIGVSITITVALGIYGYIKDVEILGFKI